jgi:IS605 OrfB family transposase
MSMAEIKTSCTADIKYQLYKQPDDTMKPGPVSSVLFKETTDICSHALDLCIGICIKEWDTISSLNDTERKTYVEHLIHTTKKNIAKYPEFDDQFPRMPSYTRRSIRTQALGVVSSYMSNLQNWENEDPAIRKSRPVIGNHRYALTFYDQDRKIEELDKGIIKLRLYDGKTWGMYPFVIKPSDARYITGLLEKKRTLLSPSIEKVHGRYRIRFVFGENKTLVSSHNPLVYIIMAVDLGINAPATWCIMGSDGTVYGRGVIRLTREEDRLNHLLHKKCMFQKAGKKSHSIYRMINAANKELSIATAREIMKVAERFNVDCIVFEHLDKSGRKNGKYAERIHLWKACDVQKRVTTQAHRAGMRISRICAWNTSKLAYDGSGITDRHVVYKIVKGKQKFNYSIARFPNGRIYNCDLSAAYNIGARFFLREYVKKRKCPDIPKTPFRTYATLKDVVAQVS